MKMKLINLATFFRKGESFKKFCQQNSLNIASEVIEIYMKDSIDLESNLAFFEIEKTEGRTTIILNDIKYINLLDFHYLLDFIAESRKEGRKGISDEEIAKLLFSYAVNDA